MIAKSKKRAIGSSYIESLSRPITEVFARTLLNDLSIELPFGIFLATLVRLIKRDGDKLRL
jgi:hypothetical protein